MLNASEIDKGTQLLAERSDILTRLTDGNYEDPQAMAFAYIDNLISLHQAGVEGYGYKSELLDLQRVRRGEVSLSYWFEIKAGIKRVLGNIEKLSDKAKQDEKYLHAAEQEIQEAEGLNELVGRLEIRRL